MSDAGPEDWDSYFANLITGADFSAACTYSTPSPALTYESIKAAIDSLPPVQPEPIGEYMRGEGCPLEEGWVLFLPKAMKEAAGPFPPPYVRFSGFVDRPVAMRTGSQTRLSGIPYVANASLNWDG